MNVPAVTSGSLPAAAPARGATQGGSCLVFHAQAVLFVGPLGPVGGHTHAAPALLVGLDGPVGLAAAPLAAPMQHAAAWCISPGWAHRVEGGGGRVAVLYLEPGSPAASAALRLASQGMAQGLAAPAGACPLPRADDWRRALCWALRLRSAARHARLMLGLCAALQGLAPAQRPAPRSRRRGDAQVLRALARVQAASHTTGPPPHDSPADRVADTVPPPGHAGPSGAGMALSASRLRHLVRAQAGTPLRRYRLWCRLNQAAQWAARGHTLTESALAAGFADQAHFTRAFRAMFGLPPSAVLARPALRVWLPGASAPLTPARPSRTRGR